MLKITDHIALLSRLSAFSAGYNHIASLPELAEAVQNILEELIEIESSGLYLFDFNENRLKLLVAKGFTDEEAAEADRTAMDRHPGNVFRSGKVLHIPDTENDPHQLSVTSRRNFVVRSRLYMPVMNGNQPVGAFGIVSSQQNSFSTVHEAILGFICNVAGGIYANILKKEQLKKENEKLAAITIRLETLIKYLRSGILVEDAGRNIALINSAFCDMFSIPADPAELAGTSCSDSAEQSKHLFTDPDNFTSRIDQMLSERQPVTGEELSLADGRIFERDYIPIFLHHEFLGNLWHYRDITHRVNTANELRKAMEEAHRATNAKSLFLANMSHEIRTPLNAVIGLSRLMHDTKLNAEQLELNNKVIISGENLLGIINEILDFSKIEAGKIELEAIPFRPEELLERVVSSMSHAAGQKSLRLLLNNPDLSGMTLIGDPIRLQQVFINLVNNAVKFTEEGDITISSRKISGDDATASILFSVTDTGIGISEENLHHIFQTFSQEDESTTRRYGGTGLGLAISRQLVALMGGDLRVSSEKGKGSTFYFTLEFQLSHQEIIAATRRKVAITPGILKGKSILVVEDNDFNQFIARSILLKWGATIEVAGHGKEAIEQMRNNRFDLVLMDMQMPHMDGTTATRIIRNELRNDVPIIALTAYATREAIDQALSSGMNDYLTKPFDEEVLFIKVVTACGLEDELKATDHDQLPTTPVSSEEHMEVHFDLDKLTILLGEDTEEIISLIETFIGVTPGYAQEMYDAADRNDLVCLAKAAHKIKSSIELLASGNLRSNIRLIHDYAKNNEQPDKLPRLLSYFRKSLPVLIDQLSEKVNEMKNG
jgi:signal transduction histidine kinase/DNA-binding response OmpR family regulator/putative methionine-R-sulfoxide reductase with GAF domain